MRLSSKTRYAVRALIDLDIHYRGKPVLIKEIARRQGISVRYLENILTVLRAGGILHSSKGTGGGFSLARKAEKISLLDIVNLLEGGVELVQCLDSTGDCALAQKCVSRGVWSDLNRAIRDNLSQTTLKDLVEKQKKIFP